MKFSLKYEVVVKAVNERERYMQRLIGWCIRFKRFDKTIFDTVTEAVPQCIHTESKWIVKF